MTAPTRIERTAGPAPSAAAGAVAAPALPPPAPPPAPAKPPSALEHDPPVPVALAGLSRWPGRAAGAGRAGSARQASAAVTLDTAGDAEGGDAGGPDGPDRAINADAQALRARALAVPPAGLRAPGAAGGPARVSACNPACNPAGTATDPPTSAATRGVPEHGDPTGPQPGDAPAMAAVQRTRIPPIAATPAPRLAAQRRWARGLAAALTVGTVSGLAAVALVGWWLLATGPVPHPASDPPAGSATASGEAKPPGPHR